MVLRILKKALVNYRRWASKHIKEGIEMNQTAMLRGAEPRKILQILIDKKVPAIMSYLSKRKWHVAKVLLTDIGANRLNAQVLSTKRPHPINIQVNQPVGLSLKYEYGKFIFETTVTDLEPSSEPLTLPRDKTQNEKIIPAGGKIVLKIPDRIEIVQRRSYFRVEVPKSLKVNVMLWHRGYSNGDTEQRKEYPGDGATCEKNQVQKSLPENLATCQTKSQSSCEHQVLPKHYWQGRLADISAGGAQIVVDAEQKPDFKQGQFIGLRFTPMPYEMPLVFDAQIRNILPTATEKGICLGLQIVGLEASPEGRGVLQRLCNVVERYYQINQTGAKMRDFQTTSLTA